MGTNAQVRPNVCASVNVCAHLVTYVRSCMCVYVSERAFPRKYVCPGEETAIRGARASGGRIKGSGEKIKHV